MNIALEKTEEHIDGVKKRSYGDAFVRGNNGEFAANHGASCILMRYAVVMYISAD
jgi:hypothetical protein